MSKPCLDEEWFIKDWVDDIDTRLPLWKHFGPDPQKALSTIYRISRKLRVEYYLKGKIDVADSITSIRSYEIIGGEV